MVWYYNTLQINIKQDSNLLIQWTSMIYICFHWAWKSMRPTLLFTSSIKLSVMSIDHLYATSKVSKNLLYKDREAGYSRSSYLYYWTFNSLLLEYPTNKLYNYLLPATKPRYDRLHNWATRKMKTYLFTNVIGRVHKPHNYNAFFDELNLTP